jgi:hypothetical protein
LQAFVCFEFTKLLWRDLARTIGRIGSDWLFGRLSDRRKLLMMLDSRLSAAGHPRPYGGLIPFLSLYVFP